MNFIKKVFENKIDESVHLQFQKFSKGEFQNRALIKAKSGAGKYTIATGAEFSNDLVKIMAGKLGENKTQITGAIVSTSDLTGQLDFKDKKQFQGVKRYIIEKEMSGTEILGILEKFPKSFFALSFEVGEDKLKIKPKSPKSGKPGSKTGEMPKADFCRLITKDKSLGESFIFEKPNFKEAEIKHTYIITDLIKPQGESDFAKIRELSKRKGKIIREGVIDGESLKKEQEFEA
jgi:hypothetical protein